MIFTNRYFNAVGIPFLLIFLGAIARKLVRSSPWIRDDFFLGVDLSIAAISAALIFLVELVTQKAAASGCPTETCRIVLAETDGRLLRDAGFLVAALFLFLLVISFHQDNPGSAGTPRKQLVFLGILSNMIGVGLVGLFTLVVKGVGR